jgi:hypothetical protein
MLTSGGLRGCSDDDLGRRRMGDLSLARVNTNPTDETSVEPVVPKGPIPLLRMQQRA